MKPSAKSGDTGGTSESMATQIVKLAFAHRHHLFHDDGVPYISVFLPKMHWETYPLRSRSVRAWLAGIFFTETDKAAGSQSLADAINTIEAHALNGNDQRVHVRIGRHEHGIYIDLGGPSWDVVEVTSAGWRLTTQSPVLFRRPKGLMPLPKPEAGGTVSALRPFVNVANDADFMMLIAVLVAWLRGDGPYPVLVINGEQGSSKSTLTKIAKALIDPNAAPLRSQPREVRDLMIAAGNSHILGYDNLSGVTPWLSDALSQLATGGGFSTRTLYENSEEQIFSAVRPVLLNGIPEIVTRPDLASRAVFLHLPTISDQQRRDERTFWTEFEQVRPQILGALLDIVVVALTREDAVELTSKPRMADFAKWIVAAEPACPWSPGAFMDVYAGNRKQAAEAALDGDPLADMVKAVLPRTATAKELLEILNNRTTESIQRRPDWFKRPQQLSDGLRRLAPAFRQVGISVTFTREAHSGRRLIVLEREGGTSSPSSPSSPAPINRDLSGDAVVTQTIASSPTSSPYSSNKTGLGDAGDAGDELLPLRSNRDLVNQEADDEQF